ncbi:MAG: c-type cytochrome [candidate division KSB1 bacterium]|nr:c-type cytochrome [candidate division KSB1 bacterium]MDZ7382942.1 c-type cytochrome [candidate division KSB1 bacterium]MDZ7395730.1 c-type cytochrome [candidate division KSB1 bacterium]MDZ7416038.1 c-type cytochrome [candidate division KSB1 bacterium]
MRYRLLWMWGLFCAQLLFAQPATNSDPPPNDGGMAAGEDGEERDIKTEARKLAEAAAAVARGEAVYRRACEACHGANGDGNGPAARALDPRPRDFTRGSFKFRSTPTGNLPTDDDLFKSISAGIPRTAMPAWRGLLTERERWDVIAYLKTFSDKFEKWGAGEPLTIPAEPQATQESIFEGRQIFKIMECWACHGQKGRGDGPSASTLKDDWGHRIKPFDFTIGSYKAGSENADVYKTFNTGLNGTPMPSYHDDFLYPREGVDDFSRYQKYYSQEEINELAGYMKTLPSATELEAMSEADREALANKRRWALVHFVKSLSRKKGLFHTLFLENTDQTR